MNRIFGHRSSVWLALIVLLVAVRPVAAYDPVPALRNLYGASHAVAWLMQVRPGEEEKFLDAMVSNGGYGRLLSGFANEKLLAPLPGSTGKNLYVAFGRYYDRGTAEFVETERTPSIRKHLMKAPERIDLSLVEHLLSDWAWEGGKRGSILRAGPFKRDEIFQKNLSSLSFFKAGYVGQVGLLEFIDRGASLAKVRAAVSNRSGLSGASIFKIVGQSRYVVYSEFFRAPPVLGASRFRLSPGASPAGMQAGVVVQNYIPR
jgi:hypothetical protein